jgi:hypothetical protein
MDFVISHLKQPNPMAAKSKSLSRTSGGPLVDRTAELAALPWYWTVSELPQTVVKSVESCGRIPAAVPTDLRSVRIHLDAARVSPTSMRRVIRMRNVAVIVGNRPRTKTL